MTCSVPRRAGRIKEAPSGPRTRQQRSRFDEKGSRSMSRMTLLEGNLWLTLAPQRDPSGGAKPGDGGYPPYDIELLGNGEALRITVAVAGFGLYELEVSIEDGELMIRGKHHEELAKDYLHRGIAARQFKRSFALANSVEVGNAELHNGLLAIELKRPAKQKRVMKIGIVAAD
jgi:HSP20 family molecular chaperone IbpA